MTPETAALSAASLAVASFNALRGAKGPVETEAAWKNAIRYHKELQDALILCGKGEW